MHAQQNPSPGQRAGDVQVKKKKYRWHGWGMKGEKKTGKMKETL